MPVMKQKSIQPARNIPYAEGILMYNGTGSDIAANKLVRADASLPTGNCLNMNGNVRATTVALGCVPLWITKHGVPAGKYGVVLPWSIVTGLDTSGWANAGDLVYLTNAVGGVAGPATGTKHRIIGVCLTKDANTGAILFDLRVGGTVTI